MIAASACQAQVLYKRDYDLLRLAFPDLQVTAVLCAFPPLCVFPLTPLCVLPDLQSQMIDAVERHQ